MHNQLNNTLLTTLKINAFFIIALVLFSCSKADFEAEIPAFITIDSFSLSTNNSLQGSSSEEITDAWVFINDDLVGTFELPARFPVLKKGNVTIKVFAGIKDNGVSQTRVRYQLYAPYEEQILLEPKKEISLFPFITYVPEAKFAWLENFESASISLAFNSDSDTTLLKDNNDVFEGFFSGKAFLQPTMDFFEANSPRFSNVSFNGTPVYLELNFKTNDNVLVGLLTDDDKIGLVRLLPTTTWKKIYINLTSAISSKPANTNFRVFFGIQSSGLTPFLTPNPTIQLDNLKVVHF